MTISHRIFYDGKISGQFCDNNLKQIHFDKSGQESFLESYVHFCVEKLSDQVIIK